MQESSQTVFDALPIASRADEIPENAVFPAREPQEPQRQFTTLYVGAGNVPQCCGMLTGLSTVPDDLRRDRTTVSIASVRRAEEGNARVVASSESAALTAQILWVLQISAMGAG